MLQRFGAIAALFLLGACAPTMNAPTPAAGLPPIPATRGALDIQVVHPTPRTPQPNVDSTYIYGSVGTGGASLTINGTPVEVQPNSAFLAYLPVPEDGTYELVARARGRTARETASYRTPEPAPAAPTEPPAPSPRTETVEFTAPRVGVVTGGADTLATGSDVTIGRPSPSGTYRWFLPRGARLAVTGQRSDQLRVRLDGDTAWFPADAIQLGETLGTVAAPMSVGEVSVAPTPEWVDIRIPAQRAPFLVETSDTSLAITLYGVSAPAAPLQVGDAPLLAGGEWTAATPGAARLRLRLKGPLWGYKAFYAENGDLVLRVRRPPEIDPAEPLRGARIAIDPGHPPGGATGPTGLTEGEANLAIALRVAEQLRARGAEVLLTRTDATPVGLNERVEMAAEWDADLLVSVHNNAFAEGVNPFENYGTSTYYFHPFAADLAEALNREIVSTTRIPDLGVRQKNLALARPTWVPSALTESLYMLIPQQEAALRNPKFLDRLAAAHVRGIEAFLRNRSR